MRGNPPIRAPRFRRNRRSGIALVLTLALLLVAAVIVTAFFSRSGFDAQSSAGYASRVSAAQIAQLGTSHVIGTLIAEMEDGSRPIGEEDSRILVPNLPEDMVPKQDRVMGESDDPRDPFVNLVKQSIPGFESYGLDLEVSNHKTSERQRAERPST